MGAGAAGAAGAATGAVFGPWGAVAGAAIGLGVGLLNGFAQLNQDKRGLSRQNDSLEMQLTQAEGLAALDQRIIDLQKTQNTAQAERYQTQQTLLADQYITGSNRQMSIFGLQAGFQNAQANAQFVDMTIAGSQAVGQARQAQAVSGLRNTGSVLNAERAQQNLYSRQLQNATAQMEASRTIVEGQLADTKTSATEAAAQMRYAGTERVTQAGEANRQLDLSKEGVSTRLQNLRDKLNQDIAWNEEDKAWLENEGLWLTVLNAGLGGVDWAMKGYSFGNQFD